MMMAAATLTLRLSRSSPRPGLEEMKTLSGTTDSRSGGIPPPSLPSTTELSIKMSCKTQIILT